MKAHLMFRDQDFDAAQTLPPQKEALVQDLELATLFAAMSLDDPWLPTIVRTAVLASTVDSGTILYRQEILKDCLRAEAVVRQIYQLAGDSLERERKDFWGRDTHSPSILLHRSVRLMEMFVDVLRQLRMIVDQHSNAFVSEGFGDLFTMLQHELADDYFVILSEHLKRLQFRHGLLISARLGEGNKGRNYILRKEPRFKRNWLMRLIEPPPPGYSYELPDRDESGAQALSELRDKGLNLVGNALAQSVDHVASFFKMLRTELAFYVGCLNLNARLREKGATVCFPVPEPPAAKKYSAAGLYNACLALQAEHAVVSNDVSADGRELVIITGANQGGKSVLLRSIGLSMLMMQCGMFVAASSFEASVCQRLFTHFKREEDAAMNSGKFDEELSRMSGIIDELKPHSFVLFNESFASTNEREGSEVARQIVAALMKQDIRVFFVTHQYEFARGFEVQHLPTVLFLRAERREDGERTFRLRPGPPLATSYGEDIYKRIFAGIESG